MMLRRAWLVLLALVSVALLEGCSSGIGGPVECSSLLVGDYVAGIVLDPRPASLRTHQGEPDFELSIRISENAGSFELSLDSGGSLVGSDRTRPFFEGGPSITAFACDTDPEHFTTLVRSNFALGTGRETMTARLVGGRLTGTITVEGYETSFEAVRR